MARDEASAAEQLAALRAELAAVRAENARLRDLLGLDRRAGAEPTAAWTPTLFSDQQESVSAAAGVDGSAA